MSRERRLCALAALPDGGAALAGDRRAPAQERILLVRRGDRVTGYVNACPHMGLPLDWRPERIAIADGELLRCSHHGAVFRAADGLCVAGPCVGESLTAVALRLTRSAVYLAASACRA